MRQQTVTVGKTAVNQAALEEDFEWTDQSLSLPVHAPDM